jgi:hypothetical protein
MNVNEGPWTKFGVIIAVFALFVGVIGVLIQYYEYNDKNLVKKGHPNKSFNEQVNSNANPLTNKPISSDPEKELIHHSKKVIEKPIEPLLLDSAKERSFLACYSDPSVQYIRETFNNILNLNNYSEYEYEILKNHMRLFDSRFVVLDIGKALMGGKTIDILFKDYPDTVYNIWVYDFHNGRYEIRSFDYANNYKDVDMDMLKKYFSRYLSSNDYSL